MTVIRGVDAWSPEGRNERERENEKEMRSAEMKLVADNDCFYCLQPLSYPAIYWAGASDLVLHPGCARDLAAALVRDVGEVAAA